MSKVFQFSLLCAFLFLQGCASQPITLNYYKLDSAENLSNATIQPNRAIIVIQAILLAEHLRGRNLVMQQSDLTLSLATKHLWAEPLEDDFGMLLARKMRDSGQFDAYYAPSAQFELSNAQHRINLVIEHFIPIASGDVVLSGYWFAQATDEVAPQRFYYQLALTQDGYTHAVAQMRQLVAQLGNDIAQTLVVSTTAGEP